MTRMEALDIIVAALDAGLIRPADLSSKQAEAMAKRPAHEKIGDKLRAAEIEIASEIREQRKRHEEAI